MDCYKNSFLMLAIISLLPALSSAEIAQKNAGQLQQSTLHKNTPLHSHNSRQHRHPLPLRA